MLQLHVAFLFQEIFENQSAAAVNSTDFVVLDVLAKEDFIIAAHILLFKIALPTCQVLNWRKNPFESFDSRVRLPNVIVESYHFFRVLNNFLVVVPDVKNQLGAKIWLQLGQECEDFNASIIARP